MKVICYGNLIALCVCVCMCVVGMLGKYFTTELHPKPICSGLKKKNTNASDSMR